MPYTLDDFTQQAPPALLAQAQAHIAARQVHDVQNLGGEVVAHVEDADGALHAVSVAIGPRGELLSVCDCDDEENALCRHAIALLLSAKIDSAATRAGKSPKPSGKAKGSKKPAQGSPQARLRAALEAAPHATLVNVLLALSGHDKQMQNLLLLEVMDVGASLEDYRAAAKTALTPRGGWRAWQDPATYGPVAVQMNRLNARADLARTQGDTDGAVTMATILLEEVESALDAAYNANMLREFSVHPLELILQGIAQLSEPGRYALFQSFTKLTEKAHSKLRGADHLLKVLVELVKTPNERETVEALLTPPLSKNSPKSQGDDTFNPLVNNYIAYQYTLLRRMDGQAAAEDFAKRNLRYYIMRNTLIAQAAARKEWALVNTLVTEGLRLSAPMGLPFLAEFYHEYALKVAIARGGPVSGRFLEKLVQAQTPEAYMRWKASVERKQWPAARAHLFDNDLLSGQAAYTILLNERAWDDMLKWVQRNVVEVEQVLYVLEGCGNELRKLAPDEVKRWCVKAIEKRLNNHSTTRRDYVEIADLLAGMQAIGLKEQARAEAQLLREKHRARRALLEEIASIA